MCTLWAVWRWCVSMVIGVYVRMRTCGQTEEGRQKTLVGLEMFAFFRLVTANRKPLFALFPSMWRPAVVLPRRDISRRFSALSPHVWLPLTRLCVIHLKADRWDHSEVSSWTWNKGQRRRRTLPKCQRSNTGFHHTKTSGCSLSLSVTLLRVFFLVFF